MSYQKTYDLQYNKIQNQERQKGFSGISMDSHMDVIPTLVDLLKLKSINHWFDGVSRVPLMKGRSNQGRGVVIGLLDQRAYMKNDRGVARSPARYPIELYNLKDVLLERGIHCWSTSQRKTEIRETLERLKSLGYIHK